VGCGLCLIPANIAEGRRKKIENEFGRFLGYALNSSSDLEYHLIVVRDTETIPESDFVILDRSDYHSAENALRPAEATLDPGARFDTETKRVAQKPAARSLKADGARQVVFS
jgi:hypothetical protein